MDSIVGQLMSAHRRQHQFRGYKKVSSQRQVGITPKAQLLLQLDCDTIYINHYQHIYPIITMASTAYEQEAYWSICTIRIKPGKAKEVCKRPNT